MKKSEIIRQAAGRVRHVAGGQRVCYCTPSREMVLSIQDVAMNNLPVAERAVIPSLMGMVAQKLREVTGRTGKGESLREFDTEDTDAAYALTDRVVEEAFEKAAVMYEEHGD
jgi:hypothetical protein